MDDFFQRIFDAVPGYVTVQNRELRIIAANRVFRDVYGDPDGGACYKVYKGRSEPCEICPVMRTFEDGRVHSSEELVTSKRGGDRQVIVYAAPIRNGEGEIDAVVELSTDITRVKQLREKFRMLFEEVPCYISVQSRDLRILETNRRFRADFGDGIGEPCYAVYKHRTEPCLNCPVAKTFEDERVHTSEEVVTSLSGDHVNVLCQTAPLRNALGEIDSVMEMSTNITELRQAQTRLTNLGMLLGSVAHGIKGLLSGLDGGLYLMETGIDKNKPKRMDQGREMIKRNVDRIRNMVLNLLYYTKDRDVVYQELEMRDLASSISEEMTMRAEQVGVTLHVETQVGQFEADHDAIHSVLINLVENAIDACRVDKGKAAHEVTLEGYVEEDSAVFVVMDNGVGMDRETREKAFSLFFSSKGGEGTGLGLYIAHKVVKAHKGTIDIESETGKGTRFIVRVPRLKPGQSDKPESDPLPSPYDEMLK